MNRLLLLTISFMIQLHLFGQFTTYDGKKGMGLKYGNNQISSAKYDSIFLLDENIATAYKKEKTYYIRTDGKVIYKRNKNFAYPFKEGLAIVKRKSKKLYKQDFGAINDSGKLCIDYTFDHFPTQYGVFLIATEDDYPRLMSPWKRGIYEPDSIARSNDSLFVFELGYKGYSYINTRAKKKFYSSYSIPKMDIYNTQNAELLMKNIYRIYHAENYTIYEDTYDLSRIYDAHHLLVFKDYMDSLAVFEHTFFCFHEKDKVRHLEVRNKNGDVLRDSLVLVENLDNERCIVLEDTLQYVMNRNGEQLSPKFTQLGEVSEGWRLVFNGFTYSYMNDSTYEMIGFEVPLVAEKHSGGYRTNVGGVIRNRLGNIKKRFGNFGRSLVGIKKKEIIRENPQTYYAGWIELLEKGHPIQNNHTVVCVTGLKIDSNYTDFVYSSKYTKRRYNIMNLQGELLNDNEYREVKILSENRFIVKETFDWIILNEKGERLSDYEFDHFNPLNEEYILGAEHAFGPYAILDSNYNVLTKPIYKEVYIEDGKIKGKLDHYPYRIKDIKKLKFK